MVRAFFDVFPQSVLLSGTQGELLLVGIRGDTIDSGSKSPRARARRAPKSWPTCVASIWEVKELVGARSSARRTTLARATRMVRWQWSDDRPLLRSTASLCSQVRRAAARRAVRSFGCGNGGCPRVSTGRRSVTFSRWVDNHLALLDHVSRFDRLCGLP